MTDGVVTVGLDSSDLQNGLRNAISATGKFKSSVEDSFGRTRRTVKGSMEATVKFTKEATVGISQRCVVWSAALGGVIASYGILSHAVGKLANELENGDAVAKAAEKLGVFTASAESAAKAARVLVEFSDTPPFGLDESIKAGRLLMGMGVSVNDLSTEMTNLGNVAAMTDMSLADLTGKLQKGIQLGVIGMRELNPMIEAGVPIVDALADRFGKTKAEIIAMIKAGKVSGKDLMKTVSSMGAKDGIYEGGMEKANGGVSGDIKKIEAEWTQLKRSVSEPIFQAVRDELKSLRENGSGVGTSLKAIGAVLSDIGVKAVQLVGGMAKAIGVLIPENKMVLKSLVAIGTGFAILKSGMITNLLAIGRGIKAHIITSFVMARRAVVASGADMTRTMSKLKVGIRGVGIALKSAFMSTGIGIAVVLVGELASALSNVNEEANEIKRNMSDFGDVDVQRRKTLGRVQTKEDANALLDDYDEEINRLEKEMFVGVSKKVHEQYAKRIEFLRSEKERVGELTKEKVKAAEEEKDAIEVLEKHKERVLTLEQKREVAMSKLAELEANKDKTELESKQEGMSAKDLEDNLILRSGYSSKEDVLKGIELRKSQIQKSDSLVSIDVIEGEIKALYELAESFDLVAQKKAENARMQNEIQNKHKNEIAMIDAQLTGDRARVVELERQLELRREMAAMKQAGYSGEEAEKKVAAIQAKRDELSRKTSKANYDEQMKLLQAKASGNEGEVARIERAMREKSLYEGFVNDGVDAKTARICAAKMAELEDKANGVTAAKSMSFGGVADSLAKVGGGGNALSSSALMTEQKKQTKELKQIAKNTGTTKPAILSF